MYEVDAPSTPVLMWAEKDDYAELFVEEMENKWMQGEPYQNAITLMNAIRNHVGCGLRDARDIVGRIAANNREGLEAMGYTMQTHGDRRHFFLTEQKFEEIKAQS